MKSSAWSLALQRFLVKRLVKMPESLMRPLAGETVRIDGQTLNLPLQLLLKWFSPPPGHLASVEETRAEFDEQGAWLSQEDSDQIEKQDFPMDVDGGRIMLRRYRPKNKTGKLPVLVFYHGGGYVGGSLKSHDAPCQHLALQADCAVIAVDYRRAPEHPFPVPVNDGIAAFRHIAANADLYGIDETRMAVGGDSAGGNLAAVVAQQTKRDTVRPMFQMLWVPWVDMSFERPSYAHFAEGLFLERAKMRWYTQHYLQGADPTDPLASPILGDTEGVAPARVMAAGFDPLRDEGIEYAQKMQNSGVVVDLQVHRTLPHPFINIAGSIGDAAAAFDEAAAALKQAFYPTTAGA